MDQYKVFIVKFSRQIIQLIESKKPDELDIGFEGISHPIMELVEYDKLKDYLLDELHTVDLK